MVGTTKRFERHFVSTLLGIALVGLVLRVAYVLIVMPRVTLGQDAIWYRLQAGLISGGVGYVDPAAFFAAGRAVPTAQFPPAWPALLALVDQLGGTTPRAEMLVGATLGAVTVLLTGFIGRRVAGERVGLVAAAIAAVSLSLIAADGSLMSEPLFAALVAGATLVALEAARRNTVIWWAALGLTLGLATLTRSDGLILAVVIVIATLLGVERPVRIRRMIVAAVCCSVAFAAVLVPWIVNRSLALDHPVAISNNAGTLLQGANCAPTYSGMGIALWDYACLTPPGQRTEAEYAARGRAEGLEYARDHWPRLPVVGAVRVLRMWGLFYTADQLRDEAVESRSKPWQLTAWATSLPVLVLAIAGVWRSWPSRRRFVPLFGLLVGVSVVGLVSWGNQRFRVAAEPAIAVFAAIGLGAALRMLATSPTRARTRVESAS